MDAKERWDSSIWIKVIKSKFLQRAKQYRAAFFFFLLVSMCEYASTFNLIEVPMRTNDALPIF